MTTILIAMDRASVRRRDANGYLHVEVSNISKANVCPYYGREIPGWQDQGLDADRIYQLYRAPEELARASHTFNNVPLLSEHMPVIPDQLPEDLIIGSTGTDGDFDGTYLRNSLVVWRQDEQDAIEEDRKRELSCGYRYRADMTPGTTEDGLQYDGVMREIMGNHVALVIEGRAGPDVMVGDTTMKLKSRTALMISGALQATIRPLLAADAKVDLSTALAKVTGPAMAVDGAPKKLADKVVKLVAPSLAADKTLDAAALAAAIATVTPLALDEDKVEEAEDEGDEDDDKKTSEDEDPDAKDEGDEDEEKREQAMDAKIRAAERRAEDRATARVLAIQTARSDVHPLVGEVSGMDSAEAIYRFALTKAAGFAEDAVAAAPLSTLQAMVADKVAQASKPLALDAKRPTFTAGKLESIVGTLPPVIRS